MANINHEYHNFDLWSVASQEIISDMQLRNKLPNGKWAVDFVRSMVVPGIVARLHGFIASRKHIEKVSYPRDWWEALKERWAPHWFLSRYPVKFTTKVLDARTIWPKFPYPSDWGKPIQFVEVREDWDADFAA